MTNNISRRGLLKGGLVGAVAGDASENNAPQINLKHYVMFLYPGIIVSKSSSRKIENRKSKFKIPKGCFGYKLFDIHETKTEDGDTLLGKSKNYSETTYFGRLMTLEDVKREMPDADNLIRNMEGNGYNSVVKTKFGQYMPVNSGDKVIPNK